MNTPIIIIGWGTTAQFFAARFAHLRIVAVATRNPVDTGKLKNIRLEEIKTSFEGIILLCVSDDAIAAVAKKLTESNGLICHCSGAVDIEVLSHLQSFGVFYPLQTLAQVEKEEKIPILIECDHFLDKKLLEQLADQGNFETKEVNSADRKKLHLAATIGNNFVHHVLASLKNYLAANHIDKSLLNPLLQKTFELYFSEPTDGFNLQTGAAKRGDNKTMNTHLEMLGAFPELKELYQSISANIAKKHGN